MKKVAPLGRDGAEGLFSRSYGEMNPLHWKREHQMALLSACAFGAVVGALLFILILANSYYSPVWCGYGNYGYTCWLSGFWVRVVMWTVLGALAGMAVVYIRQLLWA
jgi:hypothetical protein